MGKQVTGTPLPLPDIWGYLFSVFLILTTCKLETSNKYRYGEITRIVLVTSVSRNCYGPILLWVKMTRNHLSHFISHRQGSKVPGGKVF